MNYDFVSSYKFCQFKWYLKYNIEVEAEDIYSPINKDKLNKLTLDLIKLNETEAIENYYSSYPIINNEHVNEVIKLTLMIERLKWLIPNIEMINNNIVSENENGSYNLYDIHYTEYLNKNDKLSILKNNIDLEIDKLYIVHIFYLEKKQFNNEGIEDFRFRLNQHLDFIRPELHEVEYNEEALLKYNNTIEDIKNNDGKKLDKNIGVHCYNCEYYKICKENRRD